MNTAKLPDVIEEQCKRDSAILSAVAQINKTNQVGILNLSNYNSLLRFYRVTAWIFRFISRVKRKAENRNFSELSTKDIYQAENF